tara:strand:+ start:412 stop:1077 length:666 start_codon:yes stop_codon:yes gene_type:complete
MLKPQRKITRKEIKKDPFLESVDRLEYIFEKNKRTFLNIGLFIIVGFFIINFFYDKQTQKDIDSNSALGIAVVAFDNKDYENSRFQLETIVADFPRTTAFNIANFYLGKIYFQKKDFMMAEKYLNEYVNSANPEIFLGGAIKMLSNISMINGEYEKATSIIDNALKNGFGGSSTDLKLLKIQTLKSQGKIDIARSILDEISLEKNLTAHQKQKTEELIGMM